jgi:hypothetical protein
MALQPNDSLRTGANARLLPKLAKGSSVKLGENAQFGLAQVQVPKDDVFAASLRVLEGVFRFTTEVLATARRRELAINVATVTAALRGTDLWGKAAADRDIVGLIEGRIEVTREGDPAVTMDQPLPFYIAPRGRPALPVQPVKDEQLKQWAAETEIEAGRGVARRGARWKVVPASGESENEVLRVYQDVRAAGYAAEVDPTEVQGRRLYDVRIAQLPSKAEALAAALAGKHGITTPRVTQ